MSAQVSLAAAPAPATPGIPTTGASPAPIAVSIRRGNTCIDRFSSNVRRNGLPKDFTGIAQMLGQSSVQERRTGRSLTMNSKITSYNM